MEPWTQRTLDPDDRTTSDTELPISWFSYLPCLLLFSHRGSFHGFSVNCRFVHFSLLTNKSLFLSKWPELVCMLCLANFWQRFALQTSHSPFPAKGKWERRKRERSKWYHGCALSTELVSPPASRWKWEGFSKFSMRVWKEILVLQLMSFPQGICQHILYTVPSFSHVLGY